MSLEAFCVRDVLNISAALGLMNTPRSSPTLPCRLGALAPNKNSVAEARRKFKRHSSNVNTLKAIVEAGRPLLGVRFPGCVVFPLNEPIAMKPTRF